MGTRGIVIVKKNKKYRLATYNHWDSYPSELGYKVVKFLRGLKDIKVFKRQMDFVKMDPKEDFKSYGSDDWYSQFEKILKTEKEIVVDGCLFFTNCLDCEWAYVIDFDLNTFEIYKGWNKEPLTPSDRFYNKEETTDGGYYPIKLFMKYDLDDLPLAEELRDSEYEDNVAKKRVKLTKKEENTSKWIIIYRCSECQRESYKKENYCPSCGRKME